MIDHEFDVVVVGAGGECQDISLPPPSPHSQQEELQTAGLEPAPLDTLWGHTVTVHVKTR